MWLSVLTRIFAIVALNFTAVGIAVFVPSAGKRRFAGLCL